MARLRLEKGKRYRVTFAAPTTGPYRGIARRPAEGECKGRNALGAYLLWDGSRWTSVYGEEVERVEEVG